MRKIIPEPLSLLMVKLELPGIVLVTFVQVSADKLGVSNLYEYPVPSTLLRLPENA